MSKQLTGHWKGKASGVALIVALLVMMVFSILLLGFYFLTTGEQKLADSDRDNSIAFYGAQASLEKMSSDLASLFAFTSSPTAAQVAALTASSYQPTLANVSYASTGCSQTTCSNPPSTCGYTIACTVDGSGNLVSTTTVIGGTGPLVGLQGIITDFALTVIADGPNNTEVKMTRSVQEVAVPVFEFGMFSNNDLSFFAGPNFNFGGRVATNGNLFVTEGDGATLTLSDKTTAFLDVIRTNLSNGWANTSNYNGNVSVVVTPPSSYRNLAMNEGSLQGAPGSAKNTNWPTISLTTYNGNIKNGLTGAKQLNLAVALAGATPISIIERPLAGESTSSTQGLARFANQASLRIFLSDTQAAINGMPGIDSTQQPYPLDENQINRTTPTNQYYLPATDGCHPPLALSPGYAADSDYMITLNKTLLGGYIKIEIQLNATPGTWKDVTKEVLSLGISNAVQTSCATNKSIIHLETVKPGVTLDTLAKTTTASNFVPVNLFDAREGWVRDDYPSAPLASPNIPMAGIMNLIEVDVHNLQKWFANTLDSTNAPDGALALNNAGYILYTSDRRSNNNGSGETGVYGFEDVINPSDSHGVPNGVLDTGEDVDGDGVLDVYGNTPRLSSMDTIDSTSSKFPLSTSTTTPTTFYNGATTQSRITATEAQKNPVVFFRRALRLMNGQLGYMPPVARANCSATTGGFTVASENPIYILGNYNADSANNFNDNTGSSLCHVAASVEGDAVTLLSTAWSDTASFSYPDTYPCSGGSGPYRCANTTWYRTAVVGGKNNSFPQPTWGAYQDFGTDGGAHNFLRMIENWGGDTLNYKGSIVSFYISQQAVGIYKCCDRVYSPPTRGYNFDTDFQSISLLPPGTPRFTDVNALSFKQLMLPTQ